MSQFTPKDPAFKDRIQASFARQGLMATLGGVLTKVEPGLVEITLTPSPAVSQQHGFYQGAHRQR